MVGSGAGKVRKVWLGMNVDWNLECRSCKFVHSGLDIRTGRYSSFCKNPLVKDSQYEDEPPCGFRGKYPLYEERKGEEKPKRVETVMHDIGVLFYNSLKGKILTVFESQIENTDKLNAVKSITGNIISQTEVEIKDYLHQVFNEWGIKK